MSRFLYIPLVLLLLVLSSADSSQSKRSDQSGSCSVQLLRYDVSSGEVKLNTTVLEELSQLSGQIHVLTAIGDARIGKSTALNLMAAVLGSKDKKGRVQTVTPVFSVCGSLDTCTKGVWLHVLALKTGYHLIMLDVEGTDLGGDLITTQFSLLTSYVATDIVVFLKEAVPARAVIFLHELSRLRHRQQARTGHFDMTQKLYVVIRDPLQPPQGVSLKQYVVQSLTNPSYCSMDKNECHFLEKEFLSKQEVGVYSLPYVNRRYQKSLEWTLKDKNYLRTVETLTTDLKNAASSRAKTSGLKVSGVLLSGIIRTFLERFESGISERRRNSIADGTVSGENGQPHIVQELPPGGDSMPNANSAPSGQQSNEPISETGKTGSIDIESIIKSPFEAMGPGVYSYVMSNMKRMETHDVDTETSRCKRAEGERDGDKSCQGSGKDTLTKWRNAVSDFIDDIADALDDFFGSVMED